MTSALSQRTDFFRSLFENSIFLSALTSWFLAQLIKTIIMLLRPRSKRRRPRDTIETFLWRTGGMPSSHSALVASLTFSVAFSEGVQSNLFVVTFMFALIIIRDSLGVRRSSGIQSRVLNMLGRQVSEKLKVDYHPVKEIHGHAPLEVAVGILLGIFIATAYRFL
ncbi:MAG: divergent PAP2 family protein [Treponema sp.]|jgi:acid phosphatase family membrane protein YuiD|nr:divergent PAP2 family protein [Treponema sp.]